MDKSQPLISVIIPVYNTGVYLRACLDSILGQTLKEIEVLLVDDGSNDILTLEILDEYKEKDSRVCLIRKSNGGQSSARNAGLAESGGLYVAFVDHDDILNLHMYEILLGAVIKDAVDVAECRFKPVHHDHVKQLSLNRRPSAIARNVNIEKDKDFLVNHIHIWNRLYRREFLRNNLLEFDNSLLWEEDVLFSYKVLISARTVVFCDEELYFHIEHMTNTTHKLGRKIFHTFKAHDLLLKFLNEKKCFECFKEQYHARMLKDVLFNLNAVDESYEKEFLLEAHKRLKGIPLKRYKSHYSSSKKKLLGFLQQGNYEAFKRHQAFREKRKAMTENFFRIRWNRFEKSLTLLGFKWMK